MNQELMLSQQPEPSPSGEMEHRGYIISYNPKPIPNRGHDWDYQHAEYDGAPQNSESNDGLDNRSGSTNSIESAKMEIDELIADEEYAAQPNMHSPMENKMNKFPSTAAMEILAVSDQSAFEGLMESIGLPITGRIENDPLKRSQVQTETVAAVASEITEDINDYVNVDSRLHEYKEIAEDYGYVVSFA